MAGLAEGRVYAERGIRGVARGEAALAGLVGPAKGELGRLDLVVARGEDGRLDLELPASGDEGRLLGGEWASSLNGEDGRDELGLWELVDARPKGSLSWSALSMDLSDSSSSLIIVMALPFT